MNIVKIAALLVIVGLISSVGVSPSFAYWDKTEYPEIEGTIQVGSEFKSELAQLRTDQEDLINLCLLILSFRFLKKKTDSHLKFSPNPRSCSKYMRLNIF